MKKNEFFALINCFAYFCFYEIRVGGMSLKMRYYYIGYMEFLLCVTHYDGLYARGEKELERLF